MMMLMVLYDDNVTSTLMMYSLAWSCLCLAVPRGAACAAGYGPLVPSCAVSGCLMLLMPGGAMCVWPSETPPPWCRRVLCVSVAV
jgi:hypothetical protein